MNVKISFITLGMIAAAVILGAPSTYAISAKTVTINPGDTLESIAAKHDTDYVRLFNANEKLTNPDLINAGDTIRIPDTKEQLPDRYSALAASSISYAPPTSYGYYRPAQVVRSGTYSGSTTGNTYAWGNCTWYAKNKRPDLPNMLGNGGSWSSSASARGYSTGSNAQAGAIAEQAGHVAYVESINSNGTVNISEMNYNGGVGVVHYRTAPASDFRYIY